MVYYSRCVLLKNPQEWHNVPWSLGALCVRPVRTSQCARAPWLCLRRRHCLHEIDRVTLWGDSSRRRQMAAVDGDGTYNASCARVRQISDIYQEDMQCTVLNFKMQAICIVP